jgi:Ulp1 family protease
MSFAVESSVKCQAQLKETNWQVEFVLERPQQDNGFDCGVFACMFADFNCQNSEDNHKTDYGRNSPTPRMIKEFQNVHEKFDFHLSKEQFKLRLRIP